VLYTVQSLTQEIYVLSRSNKSTQGFNCSPIIDNFEKKLYYCLKFSFANSFFSGYTQTRRRRKSEEKFWEESLYTGLLFRSWGHGKKWMQLFINWEVLQRSYCLKYTEKKQNKHTLFREKLVLSFLQEPKFFWSGLQEKISSLSHEPR